MKINSLSMIVLYIIKNILIFRTSSCPQLKQKANKIGIQMIGMWLKLRILD